MKRDRRDDGICLAIMRFLASLMLAKAFSISPLMPALHETSNRQYDTMLDLGHRRLGAEVVPPGRHNTPPARKRVKEGKESSQFSYYMVSDCKPRATGYFGSTGGEPLILEYGFELETTLVAAMDKVLNIINDRIMDAIIVNTFSGMCGAHSRRGLSLEDFPSTQEGAILSNSRVTGFKFNIAQVDSSMTCAPQLHEENTCGYYSSQVKVFGYDIDRELAQLVIGYVRNALPLGLQVAAQDGAVRLALVDDLTKPISGPGIARGSNGARNSNSAGAAAGLILACSMLFISIGILGAYCLNKYRRGSGKAFGKKGESRLDISRYFDSSSLTHTYLATESDDSQARAAAQNSLPNSPPVKRPRTSPPRNKSGNRRGCDVQELHDCEPYDWRPIVVEFAPSFDPERDRYVQAMEELSSVPPSYAKHLAMSSELSFKNIQIV